LWQFTWSVESWWKTLKSCVEVNATPQPSPPPLAPEKLEDGGAGVETTVV
jgi:hypothetical protein